MERNMNKRGVILILLLVALLICGTVAAYMFRQTPAVVNEFEKATVSCAVHEDFQNNVKVGITVENTGNIDVYMRVKIASHWEDADGNIVAKASVTPVFSMTNAWITNGNSIYFYKIPVKPGTYTENLLDSPITLSQSPEGYYQVVEVFAEAIQANPAYAAAESWGIVVNAEGAITGLK